MLIILGKVTNLRPEIRKSMFTHCSVLSLLKQIVKINFLQKVS